MATNPPRDAGRPRVNCQDCRFHDPRDRLCPVARKVPVTGKGHTTTCQRFKPKRSNGKGIDTPPPAPPRNPLITDVGHAHQRLADCGLSWAVVELCVIDERLAIRYHPEADLHDMRAVARALETSPR
ncbi:MAG: hypothetical protein K9L32_11445 [Chromatiaceae bacterium]|nr:hypothetical protein [Chromatiaceae bacterium]